MSAALNTIGAAFGSTIIAQRLQSKLGDSAEGTIICFVVGLWTDLYVIKSLRV
jgi:hypothetical protein